MINLVERYVLRTSTVAFIAALAVLTAVIWLTQALREFDLLTLKGQSLVIFLSVTGLAVPSLVMIIAPIALFIAILYTLNKLNGDSELIVMSAAGLSPGRLLRPFALLTLATTLLVGFMSLYAVPWGFHTLRDLLTKVRADFITRIVREGTFASLDQGFVFHYRERGPNGSLLGIFIQDRRDPEHISTYLAESGATQTAGDENYLALRNGSLQREDAKAANAAIVVFKSYKIDLTQFVEQSGAVSYKPRERSTYDLLTLDTSKPDVAAQLARLRAELLDRVTNPLYALTFGMVALAALVEPKTTRQGRGGGDHRLDPHRPCDPARRVQRRQPRREASRHGPGRLRLAADRRRRRLMVDLRAAARAGRAAAVIGPTLTRYFSIAFARTVLAVFGAMFVLIYLIDLVEMLRRAGDSRTATTSLMALLSLLRVPSVAEQVLPFAVLFGAMFGFINLTRRLELVVARAAGMSVWQFLLPPVAVALLIGLAATGLYNPLSATFKQRADRLESQVFGGAAANAATVLWLRQRSIDGEAIIRADRVEEDGTTLTGVTAFVFEPDGSFLERVNAKSAALQPGFWRMADARVLSPNDEPRDDKTYLLATNLTAEQVTQSVVAPDNVPFWSLPATRDRSRQAGLDATAYELRFQTLMARPLLLVAMVLIAATFSLRFFRFGGVARMVSGGVATGFVLYVATKLTGDLGGAGILSAAVAAWSPAVVGSMLATFVLLHQEDG